MAQTSAGTKYPIGIQDFESLRRDGFLYIDKTDLVYELCHTGRYYFLSRPRRFGKSLLISTLDAYFQGKKDLFKGLKIGTLEKDWKPFPVLRLDFNSGHYDSVENLRRTLNLQLNKFEELYGKGKDESLPSERFGGIIQRAKEQTGQKVVILVDEYDKPLLQNIDNNRLHKDMCEELKSVFSQLKTQDAYIRFGFFTGVTKFSKVSIFSDLNNLMDITLDRRFETLCGISKEELYHSLTASTEALAIEYGTDYATMMDKLAAMYDGYHFSDRLTDMFNPFSLLCAFAQKDLGYFWFETGTPTFLVELLRSNKVALDSLDNLKMTDRSLGSTDMMLKNPLPILFQSGYLTLKSFDRDTRLYTLKFPNQEVTDGFFNFLLPFYTSVQIGKVDNDVWEMRTAIETADIDKFMIILKSFFADYDYSFIPKKDIELHYHNVVFTVCKLIGLRTKAEYHTSNGRIDMLIETNDSVFIFEFKLNLGSKLAMKQIEEKDYAAPFASDSRKIYKIGVNFSTRLRGIKDWKIIPNIE